MSRSRKHNIDELEELRSENRELKSQLKSLQRQLKKLNKELKTEFDIEELIEDIADNDKSKVDECPKCNKGKLKTTELGPRTLEVCSAGCGHRKRIK